MDATQIAVISLVVSIAAAVVSVVSTIGTLVAAQAARRESKVAELARLDMLDSTSTVAWSWHWQKDSWPPVLVVQNTSTRHRAFDVTVGLLYAGVKSADLESHARAEVPPMAPVFLQLFGTRSDDEGNRSIEEVAGRQRELVAAARNRACADPTNVTQIEHLAAIVYATRFSRKRLFVRWRNTPDGQQQEWIADPGPQALWDVDSVPPIGPVEWPKR